MENVCKGHPMEAVMRADVEEKIAPKVSEIEQKMSRTIFLLKNEF